MLSTQIFLLVAMIAPILGEAAPTKPHILEDGFVERSLSIAIRGATAHGEYRIGLSNDTMSTLVSQWSGADPNQPAKEHSDHKAFINDKSPKAITSDDNQTPGSNPITSRSSPAKKTASPTDKELRFEGNKSNSIKSNSKTISDDETEKLITQENVTSIERNPAKDKKQEEAHWLDPELFKNFRSMAQANLAQQLTIQIDKKTIPIQTVGIGPPPRHPFYLVLKFEFQVPDSGSFDLKIQDSCFKKMTGAVRYALKSHGQVMVLQSNVAPTIIRAKRVELEGLSPELRVEQTTISSQIGVAKVTRASK